ncbi:hypothetical protein ACOME3_006213 [Neoechinorhynchus agilis]
MFVRFELLSLRRHKTTGAKKSFQPITPIDTTNRITTVHPTTKNVADMYARRDYAQSLARKRYQPVRPKNGEPLVISCKRKRFNHYLNHHYPTLDERYLVSCGWKNSKYKGDKFTIRSMGKSRINEDVSFSGIGVPLDVEDKLKNQGITNPTSVQIASMKEYTATKNHLLCSAQTGSGKTFAYLLPILTKSPSGTSIIVLPSNVLCAQISHILQQFDGFYWINLAENNDLQLDSLNLKNLIISTPGRLLAIEETLQSSQSAIRNIILDEADTLFDRSFAEQTIDLVKRFGIGVQDKEPFTRILVYTATLTDSLKHELTQFLPNLVVVKDDLTNKVLSHVSQKFVRLTKSSKPEFILSLLKPSSYNRKSPALPAIIFCNRRSTSIWLHGFLIKNRFEDVKLVLNLKQADTAINTIDDRSIIVTTDVLSRGVDTQWAKHVINYDFPTVLSNYVHRCGRVGRLGQNAGECLVTNLIANASEIHCVQKIEIAVRRNGEMQNIDEVLTK